MNELPLRALYLISVEPPARLPNTGKWSSTFENFIENTLVKEPKLRASSDQCLMHPFMAEYCTEKTFSEFAMERKQRKKAPIQQSSVQY